MYKTLNKTDESKIVRKQLIRSASSIAANYRAACRVRSRAEFFAKMCIVVEEADETLFWLEILEEATIVKNENLDRLMNEVTEILSVMATARKNAKYR